MKIFVTGATGFMGKPLVAKLLDRGDSVIAISRSATRARETLGNSDRLTTIEGSVDAAGPWRDQILGCDAIIHLAGEPVAAKRWSAQQKQIIRESRTESTRGIVEAIAAMPADKRPKVLVSASGIDYYAPATDEFEDGDEVTEADPPGDQFLARVCKDWEAEAVNAEALGVRVARMRIGAVFAKGGGALEKIGPTFKAFVGGSLGNGKQWFSWVHRDDVLTALIAAVDDERYAGAFNVVGPEPARYKEFAKALGHELHRPSFWRVPGFALKIMVGEFAESLLTGRKAVPKALLERGFVFAYPNVASAIAASL